MPVACWAGSAVFDRRAGALAAAGAAGCPFLTYYAQETRMYSLVVVLSLLASAAFVLAFVRGPRASSRRSASTSSLLLYTHNWGLFLAAGMAVAWLAAVARRARERRATARCWPARSRSPTRPGCPTLLSQALHTAAPWAERPSPLQLLDVPGGLFGQVAGPLLALAAIAAARKRPLDDGARVLLTVGAAAAALAFVASQFQPAWTTRYLAILLGPLLLGARRRWSRAARGSPRSRSSRVAARVARQLAAADEEQRAHGGRPTSARRSAPATSSSPPSPSRCPRSTATCPRTCST